jgi:hypothetical protein
MINFFGERQQADPGTVALLKQWAYAAFQPSEDTTLMVTELRCTEPGCPPTETVIALLRPGQPPQQYKIHKALSHVTQADIIALAHPAPPSADGL